MRAETFTTLKNRIEKMLAGQRLTEEQTLKLLCLLLLRTAMTRGQWKIFNFSVTDLKPGKPSGYVRADFERAPQPKGKEGERG